MTDTDARELAALFKLYLPAAPARQLLCDLVRSRASQKNVAMREVLQRAVAEIGTDKSYTQ